MDMINPRERLRKQGLAPKVFTEGMNTYLLASKGDFVIKAYTAREQDMWFLGCEVWWPDGRPSTRQMPGEGSGWFQSEAAALMWFAASLRLRADTWPIMAVAADKADSIAAELSQTPLF